MKQYIIDSKKIDDENAKIIQYFEKFSINVFDSISNTTKKSFQLIIESFFISVESLQDFEIVTIVNVLIDNAFKHQITLKNKTLKNEIIFVFFNFYVFNESIDSRYDNTKFKNLLIDSNAVIKFTNDIDQ